MPVALPMSEWNRIVKWTHRGEEDPEKVRRREYVQYLNAKSKEMAKEWPNSLESVNARNEELRRERRVATEQANEEFYRRYLRRHREKRARMLHQARQTMFRDRDAPKMLLSTVVQTMVQKERQLQLEFKHAREAEQLELKRQADAEILRKAEQWRELGVMRKRLRFEANKGHQKALLEQIKERQEHDRAEHETELQRQILDNIKANEHMAAITEFERELREKEKATIRANNERSRQENEARARELAARDRMDDQLITVINQAKGRINCRTKEINAQIIAERQLMAGRISEGVRGTDAAREAIEEASVANAIKANQAAEDAKLEAQRRKAERLRRERIETRQEELSDAQQRKHEEDTLRKFDVMNRFKNVEVYHAFLEQKEEERRQKISNYREEILAQWKETDDRNEAARQEILSFYGEQATRARREEDNKVFHYAAQLLDECRREGRPTYALEKGVDRYCRLNNLYPMPDLPRSLKKVFHDYKPWNGCGKDPWWREPPPPPPDRGSDASEGAVSPVSSKSAPPAPPALPNIGVKRDGLSEPEKKVDISLPSINAESKK